MKNYKGSYTMRRDAYWKDYYPSLKFISSALILLEILLLVLAIVVFIATVSIYRIIEEEPAIIVITAILLIVTMLLIHIILTYQREMIRLKVDRNFMLYEIDQKTLKQD